MDYNRLAVVHSVHRTPAQQRVLREIDNPKLTAYEREYLEWYHGDPFKRSLHKAHEHCTENGKELITSERCGCFGCERIFRPSAITEWFRDSKDRTAFCPHCDTDAVLGDASGYPIIPEFLRAMKERWYGEA